MCAPDYNFAAGWLGTVSHIQQEKRGWEATAGQNWVFRTGGREAGDCAAVRGGKGGGLRELRGVGLGAAAADDGLELLGAGGLAGAGERGAEWAEEEQQWVWVQLRGCESGVGVPQRESDVAAARYLHVPLKAILNEN